LSVIFISGSLAVIKKIYGANCAILFLLFLAIQPGFGFMTISVFGEVLQTTFIFLAAYIWLYKFKNADRKTLLIAGILLALAIQTKVQLLQPIIVTLIIFHFIDKTKKPLNLLLYTAIFLLIIVGMRLIP